MGRVLAQPSVIHEDVPMRFDLQIDLFVADKWRQGAFTSDDTETAYRGTLDQHAEDVGYRDAANTNRDHVKVTMARWDDLSPNTIGSRLAHMRSFYRWCMEEGIRKDNPAEQVSRPKRRPTAVYRMTRDEVRAFLMAATTERERRVAFLGICAGLRNAELRGMRGKHFARPGFVHVSPDVAKGSKERWVPIIGDLIPVVERIVETLGPEDCVLPAERWRDPGRNRVRSDLKSIPASRQVLRTVVSELAAKAGINAHITPHLMRHAFGDHFARYTDLEGAQAMLGHSDVTTTKRFYKGSVTLDELTAMARGFSFLGEQPFPTPPEHPENSPKAPTRIELVLPPLREFDRLVSYMEGGQ